MGQNTYNADAFTAGPAPAIHAGTNVQICHATLNNTASGTITINCTPLPAGAEVVRAVAHIGQNPGTGGELVSVYATIGGTRVQTYIASASANSNIATGGSLTTGAIVNGNNPYLARPADNRLTSSANLVFTLTNCVGTGTASVDVAVIIEYLTRKRGD